MTQPYPLTEVFTNICPRTLGGIKRLGKVRYSYPSRMNGMAGMIQQPYPPPYVCVYELPVHLKSYIPRTLPE
jgi:hypothetical protein|uniref:Uncharacterized protein n=1 Tax=Picea sitchensis TaxID=3332 RepID=A0A6B9XS30_PICSI|nr:hypothetical protein Q903MT_gene3785 [Picea sitchensis]